MILYVYLEDESILMVVVWEQKEIRLDVWNMMLAGRKVREILADDQPKDSSHRFVAVKHGKYVKFYRKEIRI